MTPWIVFGTIITVMIILDLGVFHKKAHVVGVKESMVWTSVWIFLALMFNVYVFYTRGQQASIEFLTGYVVEKSLSLDNVFVFLMIFKAFNIPLISQHRVLMWGILGAIVLRALFIWAGTYLIQEFAWIFYVFGAFLIYSAYHMMKEETEKPDFAKHPLILWIKKHMAFTPHLDGEKFFTLEKGKRVATPLFLALVAIEFSDVVFALDSIPAIFAITTDPFIVFTSNIFAILGLRALYFILAHMAVRLKYLAHGLAFILGFIGVKMLLHGFFKVPSLISLSIIGFTLLISVTASLIAEKKQTKRN